MPTKSHSQQRSIVLPADVLDDPPVDESVIPASRRSPLDDPQYPKSKIQDQRRRRPRRLRKFTLTAFAIGIISYISLIHVAPRFLTLPYLLSHAPAPGLHLTDRDGGALRHFLTDDDLRVDPPATLEEIPQSLIDATLAAEDTRFYTHNGIDYAGVVRAARDAVIHREFVSGASTVSQQLIKITSIPRERSLKTKVIEALTARRLEQLWEKDDILVAYLNRLPYGNQLTGCRAAARGYFSKPLADLSLAESAFLAALPNKPSKLNPHTNFAGAQARQHYVLRRMLEEQLIDDHQYRAALAEPIRLIARARSPFRAPHLVELIKNSEPTSLSAADRTIRTTLDPALQEFAERILESQLRRLDGKIGGAATQGAAVVIDNLTGEVLALAGSRDFFGSPGGQINGAWIPRSPGSALKPFTYLLALERGDTAASILADVEVEYPTPTGAYRPVNFDRHTQGPVTLRHALANSLNIPTVRLLDDLGGPAVLHEALNTLGLTTLDADPATHGLGLTLGTAEVRLLELTNAYATLARLGEHLPFRLTLDGGVIPASRQSPVDDPQNPKSKIPIHPASPTRLFTPEACYILADILSDNRARAQSFGLHSPLHFDEMPGLRVAAKTGTSTDFRDNWCLGFTPDFTVGVWVGRFDNIPMRNISGVSGAGPVFHDLMVRLHQNPDRPPRWYAEPATLVRATINPLNGKQVLTRGIALRSRREIFRSAHHLPDAATSEDYQVATGKTLLSPLYSTWLAGEGSSLQAHAAIDPASATGTPEMRILSPVEGTTAYLDPDLPNDGRYFPLELTGSRSGGERIEWSSETLRIDTSNSGAPLAILTPGTHRITASDPITGTQHSVAFLVETL